MFAGDDVELANLYSCSTAVGVPGFELEGRVRGTISRELGQRDGVSLGVADRQKALYLRCWT